MPLSSNQPFQLGEVIGPFVPGSGHVSLLNHVLKLLAEQMRDDIVDMDVDSVRIEFQQPAKLTLSVTELASRVDLEYPAPHARTSAYLGQRGQ